MSTNADASSDVQWTKLAREDAWKRLEEQIHPFTQAICIPGQTYRSFNDVVKLFIAKKFMDHVQESVIYVVDGNGPDRAYLGAPRHFFADSGMVIRTPGHDLYWVRHSDLQIVTATVLAPPQPVKDIKIPRPPNAYILYRKERHHLVKSTNPGITNNEISQILGKAWNEESKEVRMKYKDLAQQVKQALLEKHPDYQYRPRRPCERRRRRRNAQNNQSGGNVLGVAPPQLPGIPGSAIYTSSTISTL